MKRLTFDGLFCDIAKCKETPGGTFCENGSCSQRKVWERLKEYEDMEEQGRLVVLDEETALAMCAGARAIEQSKRFWGATYCWDVFGKCGGPKELSYYEAANKLRCLAERALEGGQST